MPNSRPQIGISHDTREALAALKQEMRKRLGRPVSYDELVNMLIAEYIVNVEAHRPKGE